MTRLVRALAREPGPAGDLARDVLDAEEPERLPALRRLIVELETNDAPLALVVEDDPVVGRRHCAALRDLGCRTRYVANLTDARLTLDEQHCSLILLDLELDLEDGRDLLAQHHLIPTIVIAGSATDPLVRLECQALGAIKVCSKPIDLKAFAKCVRELLDLAPPRLTPSNPRQARTLALFENREHLVDADIRLMVRGEARLDQRAAMQTHLTLCASCRDRYRAHLSRSLVLDEPSSGHRRP